jgi:hypothetical protein
MGLRASLDDVEKRKFLTLPGLELQPVSCPARSQSLYRLSYPGSLLSQYSHINISSCSFVGGHKHFKEKYFLHLYTDDEESLFVQDISTNLPDYMFL